MKRTYLLKLLVIGLMLICAGSLSGRRAAAKDTETAERVSFNRDIRPIFSDTCFRCHGPDKSSRKAGLRLDVREEAIVKRKCGVTPIVPGKPEESEIIRRIFASDELELMPPKDAHKTLTARQKELIRQWVAEGAVYEGHWAYQPIRRPVSPEAPALANAPIRNPIDAFIQARLAKEGLRPSPEADRRTLIRRVSLDLTGLPPTPREVAAFVNDKSPDAYEKLVDRLLQSPPYAEKQAMSWLDAVRYADTSGFHGDNMWPVWPYRDYVLRAFRDNKPFDEFTREQIAGDLLPNATAEQKVASAYNRLNRVSAEGGLQSKEYLAKYAADRVRTTSIVWMGATICDIRAHHHRSGMFDRIECARELLRYCHGRKSVWFNEESHLVPNFRSVMYDPEDANTAQVLSQSVCEIASVPPVICVPSAEWRRHSFIGASVILPKGHGSSNKFNFLSNDGRSIILPLHDSRDLFWLRRRLRRQTLLKEKP